MASISKINVGGTDYTLTPASHTHGNIQNGGTLQTNDITIANGDKLVVTDSSDSSKIARTSISFDGSTTGQYLSKKGTWVTAPAVYWGDDVTTLVSPINADQLQGHSASYFQQALVSGTNIKTIGGESILGSGNIYIPYKAVNTCSLTLTHSTNGGTCTLTGTINGGSIASTTLTGTATYCNLSTDFSLFVNGNRYLTTVNITNSKAILACGDKYTEYTFPNNSSYAWTINLT